MENTTQQFPYGTTVWTIRENKLQDFISIGYKPYKDGGILLLVFRAEQKEKYMYPCDRCEYPNYVFAPNPNDCYATKEELLNSL